MMICMAVILLGDKCKRIIIMRDLFLLNSQIKRDIEIFKALIFFWTGS